MKENVFILHGYWNTPDYDGSKIVNVSHCIEPVKKMLDEIAESNAKQYIELCGLFNEDCGERHYEVIDENGKYAKFYITEDELAEGAMI